MRLFNLDGVIILRKNRKTINNDRKSSRTYC